MKKGFSIIALIIIILVLGGLGFGGYYAYNNYIAPMLNPKAAFIPDNLKAYAKGSDAEMFVIINDQNSQIYNLIESARSSDELNFIMKSGLIIMNNEKKCAGAAFEFDTAETAVKIKSMIENTINMGMPFLMSPVNQNFKTELKNNILIIEVNEGFKGLSGNLVDNPLFKKIDPEYADNQIIIAINNKEIPEIANLFSGVFNTIYHSSRTSLIPVANAQLIQAADVAVPIVSTPAPKTDILSLMSPQATILLHAVEDTFIYIKIYNSVIESEIKLNIMDKSTLEQSDFFRLVPGSGPEDFYEQFDQMFNKDLNEELKTVKNMIPSFSGNSEFKDLSIILKIEFDIEKMMTEVESSPPTSALDTARSANLNSFIAVAEAYKSDFGTYPGKSGCFYEIGVENYFSGRKTPKDPVGMQSFGDIICVDGYYYQYFGGDNYGLWAKMDLRNNNNTDLSPKDVEKLVLEGEKPTLLNEGSYFFLDRILNITKTEPVTTKVPRKPTGPPAENEI